MIIYKSVKSIPKHTSSHKTDTTTTTIINNNKKKKKKSKSNNYTFRNIQHKGGVLTETNKSFLQSLGLIYKK